MDEAGTQAARATPPAGPARNNGRLLRWMIGVGAVLCMCLLGLVLLVFMAGIVGVVPLLLGLVLAVIPAPLYLTLALWVDRFEKEPAWMLAGAFLWGATVATFFSFIANRAGGFLVAALFGQEVTAFYLPVISAPIVEEICKGLALFILFWWKKDEFDGVLDGIIYAAMVGLGFAMVENFLYYGRGLMFGGFGGMLEIFGLRGVISPFIHPIFTAMTGIGLGLARQSSRTRIRFLAPVLGLLAAMLLHSLWNLSGFLLEMPAYNALGVLGVYALYVLLYLPLLLAALLLVLFALRREGGIVRRNLAPELSSGLLEDSEYDALSSVRGRLGASFGAWRKDGFGGWRANSRFGQTATELAFHRDRIQRGITSSEDSEREAAYLRILREYAQRNHEEMNETARTDSARTESVESSMKTATQEPEREEK